jgi:LuxR family transcriptional regulator, maltose regulon positive regulatory protein
VGLGIIGIGPEFATGGDLVSGGLEELLPVRLVVPEVARGVVRRPLLVERLMDAGASVVPGAPAGAAAPVVMVCAPAGYGKTTLLSEWAESDPRPFGWLTISAGDNDPVQFITDVARALDTLDILSASDVDLLNPPSSEPATALLPRLARTLLTPSHPFVLVLDDSHELHSPDALAVLSALTDHIPSQSQLAIATRHEPPLALGRLQAHRRLVRIGVDELTLSTNEGIQLLEGTGLHLRPPTATALIERSEGWAAGLYLAALALQSQDNPEQAARRFTGSDRTVATYLLELLDQIDDETRGFLLATSILDHFSPALCDAVRQRPDSAAILDHLNRANLFLVPLDRTGDWYRYHHLFADLFRTQLHQHHPDQEPTLHSRASIWWEHHDNLDAAVRHAYAAHDLDRFGNLVWSATPTYLSSSHQPQLAAWLNLPTHHEITTNTPLALASAWLTLTTETNNPDPPTTPHTTGHPDQESREAEANLSLLRAARARRGVGSMLADAAMAYDAADPRSEWNGMACLVAGTGLRLRGLTKAARDALQEGYTRSVVDMPVVAARCATELAWLSIDEADWELADLYASRARRVLDEHNLRGSAAFSTLSVSAWVCARFGDTDSARRYAQQAVQSTSEVTAPPPLAAESRVALAHAFLLLGDVRGSRRLVNEAGSIAAHVPDFDAITRIINEVRTAVDTALASSRAVIPLTPAELRVLRYLPTHLSFQAIGRELILSPNTVKTQAIAIYRKLGASSRSQAVEMAVQQGLLPGPESAAS